VSNDVCLSQPGITHTPFSSGHRADRRSTLAQ